MADDTVTRNLKSMDELDFTGCVVGELEGGGRMVTVARWTDGAIAEEYVWI